MSVRNFDDDDGRKVRPWRAPNMRGEGVSSNNLYPSGLGVPTAADIETWEKDSREEGFKRGFSEGQAAAKAEAKAEIDALTKIRRSLTATLNDFDQEAEQQLVQLALLIARQLVRREVRMDPGEIIPVVREAVGLLPISSREVRVHLHPDDAALVREVLINGQDDRLHLIEDPLLQRGGCQVRSEHSFIDASMENRLAALAAQILGGERQGD